MNKQKTVYSLGLVVGSLMVLVALLISNDQLELALLGPAKRSLGWGPTLFRALLAVHGLGLTITLLFWRTKTVPPPQSSTDRRSGSRQKSHVRRPWVVLGALSLVALGLRLWRLNSDLWYDELLSFLDFMRPPLGEILTSFSSQNQHMFYSILAHISIAIFGENAAAVRLPSVVFGIASLWALFLLGRKVIGERESLFACALMTVSYHHIWFSQNARGYMGLLFFTILATWLWLEAMERDNLNLWFWYVIAVSLGIWSHMTMLFVVGTHALLYLSLFGLAVVSRRFRRRPSDTLGFQLSRFRWKAVIAWALCGTVTLQLHALALPDFFAKALHMESPPSEWSSLGWVAIESLRSLRLGFSGLAVVLCGALLIGLGWINILRRHPLAGMAMVLPAFIGGSTMIALEHYLWPRFFFFSMGFALLITVHGAFQVPLLFLNRSKTRESYEKVGTAVGTALASLMIVTSALTVPRNYAFPKQDFTGARDYVESLRDSDDTVIAVGLAGNVYRRYFAPNWLVAQTRADLDNARSGKDTWLVYTLPIEVRASRPEVWQTIQEEFEVVKVFPGTLGGGEVFVCRARIDNQSTL